MTNLHSSARMSKHTYAALERADIPPRKGSRTYKRHYESKAKEYMHQLLGIPMINCMWERQRIRLTCDLCGNWYEIPNWDYVHETMEDILNK